MPRFKRYIGIDYSGAADSAARLTGLAVFMADAGQSPVRVAVPAPPPAKRWRRSELARWLIDRLTEPVPTIVGIDHAFSFPLAYFQTYHLARDWPAFLDDFQTHWPSNTPSVRVDSIRFGGVGNGAARSGQTAWKRVTDRRSGTAKSVFHFDVNGSVAKSTHTGLPWLRFLRQQCKPAPHFWPFDGWVIPVGRSAVVEVYPRIWAQLAPPTGLNAHETDAWRVTQAMRQADANANLANWLAPTLSAADKTTAEIEGWILGVA